MKIKELAAKAPESVECDTRLREAARRMDTANVGALLVMDRGRLVGLVTDRDIVVRAVAANFSADARIDSVMSTELVTVDANADVHEAFEILGRGGVRRLPVLDDTDVIGMLTVDDLLVSVVGDLDRLVHPVVGELAFGHHPAPLPALP